MNVMFGKCPAIVRATTKVNYGKLRARATNRRSGPQIALNGPLGEIFGFLRRKWQNK